MKKFLTALTLVTLYSFSANAQDTSLVKVEPAVKQNPKNKIIIGKKAQNKQRSSQKITDSDDKYADLNDGSATLDSEPANKPKSHTVKNF